MPPQSAIPSVSILMPFHCEGTWLKEAIRSIYEQTHTDWELILIGNLADQLTLDVAHRSAHLDDRIRLIHENRPGIAHALNTGIEAASAPMIARMDADDYSLPERLARQLTFLNAHPNVDVLGTCTASHPDGPPGNGFAAFMDWQNALSSPEDHLRERFIESPVAHPTVMFRKRMIDRHGHYLTTGIPEDYELWLRWMENGAVFAKLQEPLLLWRDHPDRLTRTHPDYTKEAFARIRSSYLALELKRRLGDRALIICGADRICRRKASILTELGIQIAGYADVVQRHIPGFRFIHASEIESDHGLFFLSFVSSRGKASEMRDFFRSRNLQEGSDFALAH